MKKTKKKAVILLSLLTIILIWVVYTNVSVGFSEHTLYYDTLPEAFDGYRIAHISDLHNAEIGEGNETLLAMLKEAEPDLIAITGDLIDSNHTDIAVALAFAEAAMQIAPCYYVNGNHEWGAGLTLKMRQLMEARGVICLSNEFVTLNRESEHILICGVEDRNGRADMIKPPELAEELRQQYPEDFVLWLQHRNDSLIYYPELPVELVLSGHAHGGIVRLPFIGGVLDVRGKLGAEYEKGIYNEGGLTQLVSAGLGNSVFIPRFLNRPELPIITLRNSEISFL